MTDAPASDWRGLLDDLVRVANFGRRIEDGMLTGDMAEARAKVRAEFERLERELADTRTPPEFISEPQEQDEITGLQQRIASLEADREQGCQRIVELEAALAEMNERQRREWSRAETAEAALERMRRIYD